MIDKNIIITVAMKSGSYQPILEDDVLSKQFNVLRRAIKAGYEPSNAEWGTHDIQPNEIKAKFPFEYDQRHGMKILSHYGIEEYGDSLDIHLFDPIMNDLTASMTEGMDMPSINFIPETSLADAYIRGSISEYETGDDSPYQAIFKGLKEAFRFAYEMIEDAPKTHGVKQMMHYSVAGIQACLKEYNFSSAKNWFSLGIDIGFFTLTGIEPDNQMAYYVPFTSCKAKETGIDYILTDAKWPENAIVQTEPQAVLLRYKI